MSKVNFNKIVKDMIKNTKMNNTGKDRSIYKTEKEYEDSFGDILNFRKSFTKEEICKIDIIIYHDENHDGMGSAAIAMNYLDKDLILIPLKPRKKLDYNLIRDKNILILDLDISDSHNINELENVVESFIIIDDHGTLHNKDTGKYRIYSGEKIGKDMTHGTIGYTWKFFYPNEEVPLVVKYIDSHDGKLYLSFTPHADLFSQAIGFRIIHDKITYKNRRYNPKNILKDLGDIINDNNPNFWIFIGNYFKEVIENIKEQIAINAKPRKFQNYCVGVLNFNAPGLSKRVGMQIISNFEKRGTKIDFAVLWGYEYTQKPPSYRIQLINRPWEKTNIDLAQIAKAIANKVPGASGGGHKHIGNLYYPRNSTHDIWDLFNGKC